jgi:hypothetical protein
MTRFTPLWQQGGSYAASVDRNLITAAFPNGGGVGAIPTTVANTMNVTIPPGYAAVPLQAGANTALCRWDAAEVVTSPAAPPAGNTRIDVVVLQVRDPQLDAGVNNDFVFLVVSGANSTGTPVAPAVPANALAMVQYTVGAAVANLNASAIVDRRLQLQAAAPSIHSRVHRAGAWSPGTLGPNIFLWDTVDDDTLGMYSTGSGLWTVPLAGCYLMSAVLAVTATAVSQYLRLTAYRNGAGYLNGTYTLAPAAGQGIYASCALPVRCQRADTLATYYDLSTAGLTGGTGPGMWASVDYLGA